MVTHLGVEGFISTNLNIKMANTQKLFKLIKINTNVCIFI